MSDLTMTLYRWLSIAGFLLFGLIVAVVPAQAKSRDKAPIIFGGLAWSPDGSQLAVGTSDGVWIHDAHDLSIIQHRPSAASITAMDWQPNGDLIASVDADGIVEVWNANTGNVLFNLAERDPGLGTSVRWSPDGTKIASTNLDGTLRIWDAETGKLLQTIQIIRGDAVSWNPEGTQVVLNGLEVPAHGPKFGIWDALTGQLIQSWTHDYLTASTSWSPDGRAIATASQWSNIDGTGGTVTLFNPDSGAIMTKLETSHAGGIGFLAWSPDSSRIASQIQLKLPGTYDWPSELQIWDVKQQRVLAFIPNVYDYGVGCCYSNAVAWSRDGSKLASISDDGKVYIWDGNTYQQLAVYDGYKSMI